MKTTAGTWLRFNAVGLAGVAIQLLALALLEGRAGLATVPATAIAVEAAVLHNFVWHERWTWKQRGLDPRCVFGRFLRFNAGNGLISLVGNIGLMWLLVSHFKVDYLISNAAAIALCSSVNFLVSDRLVFE
jgi:putative flippase GtrA